MFEFDELMATFVPIGIYWIYSGIYVVLEKKFKNLRLHNKDEEEVKNCVSKRTVVKGVLFQHLIQMVISLAVLLLTKSYGADEGKRSQEKQPPLHVMVLQIYIAMVVLDAWQYFTHRMMHMNSFMYKHIHFQHHELVATYAFGALYTHPIEGLISDSGGGVLAYFISGMSPRTATFFFSFASIKAIDDHSGLWIPGNPLRLFFKHNSGYHDFHHQPYGAKFNFSNSFFVTWDKLLGTYMPYPPPIHKKTY